MVKTGEDGKMFGSVTAGTIADQLKNQFEVMLDKKKIHLEHPIRTLGEHEVELRLHADVVTKLKVRVESSTPIAKVEAPAVEETKDEKTEKRGKRPERVQAAEGVESTERAEKKPRAPKAEKAAKPGKKGE
jgi:large subunit ribosomal protein L9